jgi:hypothetical protein
MADVFVSYKREDRTSIAPLVRLLEREGLSVWWDPCLVAGERWDEVISREIERANCIVVAWSSSSIHATWVRDEAETGRDREILVPFSIDGARPPLGFRRFQTPDLTSWAGDAEDPRIRQLVAGVLRLVRDAADADDGTAVPPPPRTDSGNREAMLRGLTELVTTLPDEFAWQAEKLLEGADSGDRGAMLRGLAELHAKLPDEFTWQAEKLLEGAGARKFVPNGAVFDARVHHAIDTEPTWDVGLGDTVARTLRPGWMDHDQVVVPARVVVYVVPDPRL